MQIMMLIPLEILMEIESHSDSFIVLDEIIIKVALIDLSILADTLDKNCIDGIRFLNITD
jgi:hypothetical protein